MGAVSDYLPAIENQNVISPADLRQPVRDQQCRAALLRPPDRALDLVLGRAVDGAGRVIENQDARIIQKGACQGDALPLPARQRRASLAHHRLVAIGESS